MNQDKLDKIANQVARLKYGSTHNKAVKTPSMEFSIPKTAGKSNIYLSGGNIIKIDSIIAHNEPDENKVLVTGHLGHLGKPTNEYLNRRFNTIGYDLLEGDNILDLNNLLAKMDGCMYVVHCAGIPHPNPKYDFTDYFLMNVIGTLNVCKAAREVGVKRVVYLSTGGIYGWDTEGKFTPDYFPIDETHVPASISGKYKGKLNSYAQSKLIAEQVLIWYASNEIFEVVCLRLAPALPLDKKPHEGKFLHDRNKTFWTNTMPDTCARAVDKALSIHLDNPFEIIHAVEREAISEHLDMNAYICNEWPDVEIRDWSPPRSLMDTTKADRLLNLYGEDDVYPINSLQNE